jgi:orotate phosphoribosyltransferase
MSNLKADLARQFVETGSFKSDAQKNFRLSSGVMSAFYVDCKNLMSLPKSRLLVAQLAFEQIKSLDFRSIGGLEIGAIAIATTISDFGLSRNREWSTFVVRKRAKDHGLQKLIEGPVKAGDKVLIVDDVLTSGGSIINAVKVARAEGLEVEYALVVVDREEQDGRKRLEEEGVTLISLLTINELQIPSQLELATT